MHHLLHLLWPGLAGILMFIAFPSKAAGEDIDAPCEKKESPAWLMLPPLERNMTRIVANVRPFFNLVGSGGGALSDLSIEHYFEAPWKIALELSPLALVYVPEGFGTIANARVRGAFAADYVELGLGVGGRFQRWGPDGWSVSPSLRLGSIDGMNLRVESGYSLVRNYYTGVAGFAWSYALGALDIPVAKNATLTLEGGYGIDLWVYSTLGLKQKIYGDGGPGTLSVGGSLGLVWIIDRFPCQYGDIAPCRGASWGIGPTIAIRIDRRFGWF